MGKLSLANIFSFIPYFPMEFMGLVSSGLGVIVLFGVDIPGVVVLLLLAEPFIGLVFDDFGELFIGLVLGELGLSELWGCCIPFISLGLLAA